MSKQKLSAYHATVHGRVQGVGFRFSAQREALRLGLTGWVRNCGDGTVETHFEGTPVKTADFLSWLHKGPPGARVLRVDNRPVPPQEYYKTFNITY
jgi:acylphosphatase